MKPDLLEAINAVLSGDWQRAHKTVQQEEDDPVSCWVTPCYTKELAAIKREIESER